MSEFSDNLGVKKKENGFQKPKNCVFFTESDTLDNLKRHFS